MEHILLTATVTNTPFSCTLWQAQNNCVRFALNDLQNIRMYIYMYAAYQGVGHFMNVCTSLYALLFAWLAPDKGAS